MSGRVLLVHVLVLVVSPAGPGTAILARALAGGASEPAGLSSGAGAGAKRRGAGLPLPACPAGGARGPSGPP
jgi:hypothetical protein